MPKIAGMGLVLVSALAFGIMPILARFVYSAGCDPVSLLFFRFLIGALCMAAVLWVRRLPIPRGRVLVVLLLMGLLGYAGQSLAYFTALMLIPAGLVAILLYLYPVMVMVLAVFFLKDRLSAAKLLALVLALSGTLLVIGMFSGGSPAGIAWGLSAAMIYSIYVVLGARVMRNQEPLSASTVVMAGATLSMALLVVSHGLHLPHSAGGWIGVVCIGFFCTAVAISSFFAGMRVIGAVDASLVSTFEPVTTVVLGVAFLGEQIAPLQILGMGMILCAATLLALRPAGIDTARSL